MKSMVELRIDEIDAVSGGFDPTEAIGAFGPGLNSPLTQNVIAFAIIGGVIGAAVFKNGLLIAGSAVAGGLIGWVTYKLLNPGDDF